MVEFIEAVQQHAFMRNALLVGLLASVACGIVGSYVTVRRISYIAGSIAHCVLAGIGGARYLQLVHGWQYAHPLAGAVLVALLAAVLIGLVSMYARQREDTVIGAVWAVGMAVGVMFIMATPGYNQDLESYLFGNILLTPAGDLWLLVVLDVIVVGVGLICYRPFMAVCFDEEFARIRGLNVTFYYLLLLCLVALTVVLLVSVVGIVLVIALITLPAAVAGRFALTLWQMMLYAVVACAAFTVSGMAISYAPGLPAGATIIVIAGLTYLFVLAVFRPARARKRPVLDRRP